jgi:hypothetical protein
LSTAPDNNAAANGQAEFIDTLEMKHHLDNNKEIKKPELEYRV